MGFVGFLLKLLTMSTTAEINRARVKSLALTLWNLDDLNKFVY